MFSDGKKYKFVIYMYKSIIYYLLFFPLAIAPRKGAISHFNANSIILTKIMLIKFFKINVSFAYFRVLLELQI